MKKYNALLGLGLIALLLTGCLGASGHFSQATGTEVRLAENNYIIVKTGATGQSRGWRLFGLIPFSSPTYADAKAKLYKSAGTTLEGRSIALANQTEDEATTYLILFSIPKLTLTADIVEFIERKGAGKTEAPSLEPTPSPSEAPSLEPTPSPSEAPSLEPTP